MVGFGLVVCTRMICFCKYNTEETTYSLTTIKKVII